MLSETSVPGFARGVRFRHDDVRGQWVILAPERALVPDETAVEIVRLIDGRVCIGRIIDLLAEKFAAPRALIAADVLTLLGELEEKGLLRSAEPGAV